MPEHLPDRVDRAIVTRLQRDGRIANVDLADAISLSPSACLRRVKALEASGIIAGYRAEVSRERAGLGLTVFIGLKVEKHSQETSTRVEQALRANKNLAGHHANLGYFAVLDGDIGLDGGRARAVEDSAAANNQIVI